MVKETNKEIKRNSEAFREWVFGEK